MRKSDSLMRINIYPELFYDDSIIDSMKLRGSLI